MMVMARRRRAPGEWYTADRRSAVRRPSAPAPRSSTAGGRVSLKPYAIDLDRFLAGRTPMETGPSALEP